MKIGPALARRLPLAVALLVFVTSADAAAQSISQAIPKAIDDLIETARDLRKAAAAEDARRPLLPVDELIARAQASKKAAAGEAARGVPLDALIATAQGLRKKAAGEAAARASTPIDTLIDRARELKRQPPKPAPAPAPMPEPAPTVDRLIEDAQGIKRKVAEEAEARSREAASLIRQVDVPDDGPEHHARKVAFVREHLDPMLGDRRIFLVNLDDRIKTHGILAFVAGLSESDKRTCRELIAIIEDQRTVMKSRPDLFDDGDLRANLTLSNILKVLTE